MVATSAIAAFVRFATALRGPAAAFLLLAASPEAFGQSDGSGTENADQPGSVALPSVNLDTVTLGDQVTWSFLALLAPERLEDGIPLYAYSWDDAFDILEGANAGTKVDLGWHVGAAMRAGDEWKAYPVPAQEMELGEIAGILRSKEDILRSKEDVVQDSSNPYVVSNIPLAGPSIKERLWIPREDWLNALPDVSPSGFP
ncbi:MAG: hypothetical protein OXD36_03915 [Rhodobacter sp.]|nr:hypothetical protein [Rhodobacter sp.]